MRLWILYISDRSECKVFVQKLLDHSILLRQSDEHLNSSLAVTNVMHFLRCLVVDVSKNCREIKVSHMLESELPELFIFVWVIFGVVSWMFVSSTITEPDIISSVGHDESRSPELVIYDPSIRWVYQPMLE